MFGKILILGIPFWDSFWKATEFATLQLKLQDFRSMVSVMNLDFCVSFWLVEWHLYTIFKTMYNFSSFIFQHCIELIYSIATSISCYRKTRPHI